jgi:hypothetical protein
MAVGTIAAREAAVVHSPRPTPAPFHVDPVAASAPEARAGGRSSRSPAAPKTTFGGRSSRMMATHEPLPLPIRARRGMALGVALVLALPLHLHAGAAAAATLAGDPPAAAAPEPAAAPAATTAPAAATSPASLDDVRALYDEGRARFDTFDYEGAVELWTKAYGQLPPEADEIRNKMVYNIATAQQLAYDVDRDPTHLRQAVLLLEQYIKSYKVLHVRTPETKAEVQRAQERIAALQERIERAERGEPEPSAAPDQPATAPSEAHYGTGQIDGIVWTPVASGPPDADKLHRNRRLATADKKTDNMLIGSYVALSVGGLLAVAGTGAVLGTQDAGQGAQGAGYGTLALGLAGLTTGVALLVVGLERRKKARQGTLVAATPVVGPRFAGAAVSMRF